MPIAKLAALDATGAELTQPLEVELSTIGDKLVNIQQVTFKVIRNGNLDRIRVKVGGDSIDIRVGENVALSTAIGLTIVPQAIAIPRGDTPIA